MAIYSPFLTPCARAEPNTLALLSLKRDQTVPITLRTPSTAAVNQEEEEAITNTRFGSFPHSTLVHQQWGSQIVASNVGARERQRGKKRKRGDNSSSTADDHEGINGLAKTRQQETFEAASSGFAHLIPPTPESWTTSLPHRTQVVYTPDYSYVLQRLGARPGDCIIEAGAGSGSFTHAAARAVFNGYPYHTPQAEGENDVVDGRKQASRQYGTVYSFEYHRPRFEALQGELKEHGLESIVTLTHRDVYEDGFSIPLLSEATTSEDASKGGRVTAVFLDLPAPWQALPHLSRTAPNSPLHPDRAVMLCSFSPCIEQAIRTSSTMRSLGWVDVSMAAMQHRRLDVRRERIGLAEEGAGIRGVTAAPASVDEALGRLRELEDKTAIYHEARRRHAEKVKAAKSSGDALAAATEDAADGQEDTEQSLVLDGTNGVPLDPADALPQSKTVTGISANAKSKGSNGVQAQDRKLFKEGRLVHRTEPDLKTHTSYLLFGTLPPVWSAEDEERCSREQEQE